MSSAEHYRPPHRLGLGGVPIGNAFQVVTDAEAQETLEAAWASGIRYYDVAPWYGLGLAERRYGRFLHNQKRGDYVLSTKVGRLLRASPGAARRLRANFAPALNDVIYDYSASGVRRSIEDSLQRLGIERIDIVFVHDLSPDNPRLSGGWVRHFEIAARGAFPELTRMREEGLIKGWGLGVNRPEPILRTLDVADPDIFLLASQYSLIDHRFALDHVFPEVRARSVSLVMGSPLNAGFLSGSARYNYGSDIPTGYETKRSRFAAIAKAYGVSLRTAALQFAAMPDVAATVIPGARTARQITEDAESMKVEIPAAFWAELKTEGLIAQNAPTESSHAAVSAASPASRPGIAA
jgi:D-threo-aldose 1-dehydrogenase